MPDWNRVKLCAWRHSAPVLLAAAMLVAAIGRAQADPPAKADLDQLRRFYLRDVHVLRDGRPGKISFVEGPDRRIGSYQSLGQRLTLLDVQGNGRLCHIWSTWREGQGNHRLEFYVDGADQPTIRGTLDELIAAAQRMTKSPVPVPGFVGNRGARNLFLPIPFQRGLRIEMETVEPTWLIFWQIDYRLDGEPLPGRLQASLIDGRPEFRWEPASQPAAADAATTTPSRSVAVVNASEAKTVARWDGPAIVRRWSLRTDCPMDQHDHLDLEVRYNNQARPAVRATLADFFGPFRGVPLHTDPASGQRSCYLPMPFSGRAEVSIRNRLEKPVKVELTADIEPVGAWDRNWGYFHAQEHRSLQTNGYQQHEVLYVRGRGHWLGMSLYDTGHDHGGGDFAVLDAESDRPAFLHGINGEDYFTFAWFGRGEHHPYAIAHSNEKGRCRFHFENLYTFHRSASIYWGAFPDLSPRSVAYWYQDSPDDSTVEAGQHPESAEWDCFGPVPLRLDAQHRPVGDPYAVLPSVAELDAGKQFECRCVGERFTSGWMKQRSVGQMLDLTYLARHGTRIKGEVELGGMGHAMLARRPLTVASPRSVTFQISHDDPLRVLVNGRPVYWGSAHAGFATERFRAELQAGENQIVVQLTNFFNVNFNWAGFALRMLDDMP